jgi:predicted PurR-regulated permease PerM
MGKDEPTAVSAAAVTPQGWFRGVVTFAILLVILHQGESFLVPVAIALFIFILIEAIGSRTHRLSVGGRTIPGWLARILSAAIVLASIVLVVLIISSQIREITDAAPEYTKRLQERIADLSGLIGQDAAKRLSESIENFNPAEMIGSLRAPLQWLLTSGILILFYTIFMIAESNAFTRKLPHIVGSEARARRVLAISRSATKAIQRYMWINTLTSLVAAVLSYAILALTGTDFASALAVLIFFTAFIPTIGTVFGIAVPALVALLQFGLAGPFFIVLAAHFVMRMLVDNALQPAMAGRGLNLSTLMVMLALAFWGGIWGLVGAFLSVPLMVVAMIVFAQFPALRPFAALMSSDGIVSGSEQEPAGGQGP